RPLPRSRERARPLRACAGTGLHGSMEYGCAVAGARLILVVGHTRCGAVTAAVDLCRSAQSAAHATGCQHLDHVIDEIHRSIDPDDCRRVGEGPPEEKPAYVERVARANVVNAVASILERSQTLRD